MQDNEIQKKKEKRNLIIYAAIAIVILVIIIIIPIIRSSNNIPADNENKLENNEAEIVVEDIANSYVVFQNADFIRQTFGTSMSDDILDSIQSAIIENHNDTVQLFASVDGQSIMQAVYFPYTTYSMTMNLSDGGNIAVNLATNKKMYTGVLTRLNAANAPRLSIIFSKNVSSSSYDRDTVISGLINWAKNTTGASEIIVTTKN